MGTHLRVSSRTYRESHPTKMLARFAVQARMAKVRALSGSAAVLGGAPPGYQNIYLPDKEMPQPLPEGGMTPALRAQLARKYNMLRKITNHAHGRKTGQLNPTVTIHSFNLKTHNPVNVTTIGMNVISDAIMVTHSITITCSLSQVTPVQPTTHTITNGIVLEDTNSILDF